LRGSKGSTGTAVKTWPERETGRVVRNIFIGRGFKRKIMDKTNRPSPAVELVRLVWRESCVATPHSWRRFNGALNDALRLSIISGMKFERNDIKNIYEEHRGWYWFGDIETLYALAVTNENIKASQSFEKFLRRKPFMFRSEGRKSKRRLVIGNHFRWRNEIVTVTSFSNDNGHLIACSYYPKKYFSDPTKIKNQYKITINDLKIEMKFIQSIESIRMKSNFWAWFTDLLNETFSDDKKIKEKFLAMF
jgi:hypothetical protein